MRTKLHYWVSDHQTTWLLLKKHGSSLRFLKVFGDGSILNPLELDWPFPLSSYSYFKISINTGVNSNVYVIRVAKKSVSYSPPPYTVSGGGASLRLRDFSVITSLLLPIHGMGGYCSLLPPHWSLFFRLSFLISCLIVRDRHDKRLRFSYVFFQLSRLFLAQNGRFCIFQKCDVIIRIFEKLNYSDPPLQQFLTIKASNSTFVLCRMVALCQSGRMPQLLFPCWFCHC